MPRLGEQYAVGIIPRYDYPPLPPMYGQVLILQLPFYDRCSTQSL